MSGVGRGWIKLWRSVTETPIFGDPPLLQLWIAILTAAAHRPQTVPVRTGRSQSLVSIQPGQMLFGRKAMAAKLLQPESTTAHRLARLAKLGYVSTQAGTHYTVVTVCNWDTYQNGDGADWQASERPIVGQLAPNCWAIDTYKNVKNEENGGEAVGGPAVDDPWLGIVRTPEPDDRAALAVLVGEHGPDRVRRAAEACYRRHRRRPYVSMIEAAVREDERTESTDATVDAAIDELRHLGRQVLRQCQHPGSTRAVHQRAAAAARTRSMERILGAQRLLHALLLDADQDELQPRQRDAVARIHRAVAEDREPEPCDLLLAWQIGRRDD